MPHFAKRLLPIFADTDVTVNALQPRSALLPAGSQDGLLQAHRAGPLDPEFMFASLLWPA